MLYRLRGGTPPAKEKAPRTGILVGPRITDEVATQPVYHTDRLSTYPPRIIDMHWGCCQIGGYARG